MSEQETPSWNPDMFYSQAETESKEPTEEANNQAPEEVDADESQEEQVLEEETQSEEGAGETESEESEPQLSDDEYFVELSQKDGEAREVNLKQIKEWEKGYLRQSDYTKKTQKLAEERKLFEADRQGEVTKAVATKLEGVDDLITEMETLIAQTDEAIDWDELRQYDLPEYTKQKELKEARINAVANAKLKRAEQTEVKLTPEEQQREQQILQSNNPEWFKDGSPTEAHTKDMKLLSDYLVKTGYTIEEQNQVVTAKHWQTLIDAAKWNAQVNKAGEVKKAVKKVPISPKPKKTQVKQKLSRADRFYSS